MSKVAAQLQTTWVCTQGHVHMAGETCSGGSR